MKPSIHAIASLSIGTALWLFTRSIYAGILCFLSGFLIDIDHIIDYVMHYGWKDIGFTRLYLVCEQTAKQEGEDRFQKIRIVFHIGELAILLWIISIYTKNIYLLSITIGYSVHLILDCIGNPFLYPDTYFIIYRAVRNFEVEKFYRKTKG